jgi:hypothetical protein
MLRYSWRAGGNGGGVVSTFATSPSTCVLGLVEKVLTTKVKNKGSSSASDVVYPPRCFAPFCSATSLSLTSRVTRYRPWVSNVGY